MALLHKEVREDVPHQNFVDLRLLGAVFRPRIHRALQVLWNPEHRFRNHALRPLPTHAIPYCLYLLFHDLRN